MYGQFDPFILYGILESNRDSVLDSDWLQSNFPSLDTYASDVVRNYMGSAIYGVPVYLDPKTGSAYVSEEDRVIVQRLYDRLCAYYKARGASQNDLPEMGYFLAMSGDYECEHEVYVPESDAE
jgi:hypothetical protein